jgi:hypothetical protein
VREYVKGGLFVGAAVAVGAIAGLVLVSIAPADQRGRSKTLADRSAGVPRAPSAGPRMPQLVGRRLDQAEDELDRRGIVYEQDGAGTVGRFVPVIWEVCDTAPGAGETVAGTVKLYVELPGQCPG